VPEVQKSGVTRFGTFEVDLEAGELRKHGIRIKLSGQPFEILAILLNHPNQVVTREELRSRLWPNNTFVDYEHSLNAAVNKLRECLGDSANEPRYVETLPRRGYRLRLPENQEDTSPGTLPPTAQTPAPFRVHPSALWIAAASLAGVLVALLVWKGWNWRTAGEAASAADRTASILVLPLENHSNDSEQEYFADGMTEALITNLGKVSALRVISQTTAFQYKDTKKPLAVIARELNVNAVLEGSVLRSGERVRITVQLVDPVRDRQLWAESYERDLRDILTLQGGVASDVASQIQVQLTRRERAELHDRTRIHPQAYEYLLLGHHFLNRQKARLGANATAVAYFEKALAVDSGYAPAYAGLAQANLYRTISARGVQDARAMARRALELDDRLAEAHATRGSIYLSYDWNWAESEKEFRRAIELNPGLAEAHAQFALFWWAMGKPDRALLEAKKANEIDPLSVSSCLGRFYYFNRQYDRAVSEYQRVLSADPDHPMAHFFLGIVYAQMGREKEAAQELIRAAELRRDTETAAALASGFAAGGFNGLLKVWVRIDAKRAAQGQEQAASVALEYARLGEKEKAFEWLERACQERSRALVYVLRADPQFDLLRSDPRYQQLLQRIGLPE